MFTIFSRSTHKISSINKKYSNESQPPQPYSSEHSEQDYPLINITCSSNLSVNYINRSIFYNWDII